MCDVRNRLATGLSEQHPLAFTLLRKGLLDFLHDQCSPLSEYMLIFYYSTKLEQSQFKIRLWKIQPFAKYTLPTTTSLQIQHDYRIFFPCMRNRGEQADFTQKEFPLGET